MGRELRKLRGFLLQLFSEKLGIGVPVAFIKGEWRGVREGFALTCVLAIACSTVAFGLGRCTCRGKTASTATRSDEWRALSEREIARWATDLESVKPKIEDMDVYFQSESGATSLYRSLQSVCKKSDIGCHHYEGYFEGSEILEIQSENASVGNALLKLFKEAGYPVRLDRANTKTAKGVALVTSDSKGITVQIFIGDKL